LNSKAGAGAETTETWGRRSRLMAQKDFWSGRKEPGLGAVPRWRLVLHGGMKTRFSVCLVAPANAGKFWVGKAGSHSRGHSDGRPLPTPASGFKNMDGCRIPAEMPGRPNLILNQRAKAEQ